MSASPRQRAFELHELGLTTPEIAESLGCKVGEVDSLLNPNSSGPRRTALAAKRCTCERPTVLGGSCVSCGREVV